MTSQTPRKGKIYTIAGSDSFAASLAAGIKARHGDPVDPLALARVRLLVPTRRAVLSLRQAFMDLEPGGVSLMPQILPLGDVGEDDLNFGPSNAGASAGFEDIRAGLPAAIAPLKRQLLLAQLIARRADLEGLTSPASAAALAADLMRFFDAAETEEADLSGLDRLVPENLADHWKSTVDFLKIVTSYWPDILEGLGVLDPVARRSHVLSQLAQKWRETPPKGPVIIAGSTGSIPATQRLMKAVLAHETGALVLPGLDVDMASAVWDKVGETHPQFGLKALLEGLELERGDVEDWDGEAGLSKGLAARRKILSQVMLPADATESWLDFTRDENVRADLESAFEGLQRIAADDARLEALTIALIMREAIEVPHKSVALVTPDRGLARRVSVELKRWSLDVDDSAGVPLKGTPVGSFLAAVLEVFDKQFAPVPLLALLKHPLTGLGLPRPELRALAARLEIKCLRGPRPAAGLSGLARKLGAEHKPGDDDNLADLIARLEACFAPLLLLEAPGAASLVRAHAEVAEALAASAVDEKAVAGADRLWVGEAGETAASFFAEFLEDAEAIGELETPDYAGLFDVLIQGRSVRPGRGSHPRAFIWGPLEARLQSADTIILGGLNEKVWPQAVDAGPWLSRPMRTALGMSQPERRIGQSAHDFVQLAGASKVILTRSLKVDGAPSVASRWLMRLENMLKGLDAEHLLDDGTPYLVWAKELDQPGTYTPCDAPRPTPPVAARPRALSVTEIETWLRDPYAIYARRVLRLRSLDAIDAPVGALERGNSIHKALERFVLAHMDTLPEGAAALLIAEGLKAFDEAGASDEVKAFWIPRFERIADWFVSFEEGQRARGRPLMLEAKGKMVLDGPAGPFTLNARGDRFDLFEDGAAGVYDYKTGRIPSKRQIENLIAPQLALEALIVGCNGFEGVGSPPVRELGYIQISGGKEPGKFFKYAEDVEALVERAGAQLEEFIATYDDPLMPYRSRVMPMFVALTGRYDHLARVKEWSVYGADDGASE